MTVVSVNRGSATSIAHGGREFRTGIDKRPCTLRVTVSPAGIEGDTICDLEHHGGADQAIYAYGADHYAWWANELGRDIAPGTFGDNLTVANLPDDLFAGDRLLVGEVELEATGPRIPCSTLAAKMQDSNFGLTFRRAEKPGFYFRVKRGGDIGCGDAVELRQSDSESNVSMLELYRLYYDLSPDPEMLRRAVESPIAERLRKRFGQKLEASSG